MNNKQFNKKAVEKLESFLMKNSECKECGMPTPKVFAKWLEKQLTLAAKNAVEKISIKVHGHHLTDLQNDLIDKYFK